MTKFLILSGFKKSGKDTFADLVLEELGGKAKKYDLAGKLKQTVCQLAELPLLNAYDEELKEVVLDKNIPFGEDQIRYVLNEFKVALDDDLIKKLVLPEGFKTLRHALQYTGTEVLRCARENIHCDFAKEKIDREAPEVAIISDCRFYNELNYFNSLTLFVHRKAKIPEFREDLHNSEKVMFELMKELPWVDNNSSLDDLKRKAVTVSKMYK